MLRISRHVRAEQGAGEPFRLETRKLNGRTSVHHHHQPGLTGASSRCPVDHAELEPYGLSSNRDRLVDMRASQVGSSEDVDHVDLPPGCLCRRSGLREVGMRGKAIDLAFPWVDRQHLVAVPEKGAGHVVARTHGVRGAANDRPDPQVPQDVLDVSGSRELVEGHRELASS